METNFLDLVQDVISEDELINVVGGVANPPKYGCGSGVCNNSITWSSYCSSAPCESGS